jgi:hypothetical protein
VNVPSLWFTTVSPAILEIPTSIQALCPLATKTREASRLVGGLACSVYCEPRTTKDTDVAISVDTEQDLDNLLARLEAAGSGRRQLLMHIAPTSRLG